MLSLPLPIPTLSPPSEKNKTNKAPNPKRLPEPCSCFQAQAAQEGVAPRDQQDQRFPSKNSGGPGASEAGPVEGGATSAGGPTEPRPCS